MRCITVSPGPCDVLGVGRPLAGLHACRRGQVAPGKSVAVLGAGPIGAPPSLALLLLGAGPTGAPTLLVVLLLRMKPIGASAQACFAIACAAPLIRCSCFETINMAAVPGIMAGQKAGAGMRIVCSNNCVGSAGLVAPMCAQACVFADHQARHTEAQKPQRPGR